VARGLGGTWAGAVVVGCITAIALTVDRLPLRVASHFDPSGLANGYSSRLQYLVLAVGLTAIGSFVPAAAMSLVVRRWPASIGIPDPEYWFAPERRAGATRVLDRFANLFAAALACFMLAVHFLVIRAHSHTPPRFDTNAFMVLLAAFGVTLIAWLAALLRRFHRRG
jgi:hypothetical protein